MSEKIGGLPAEALGILDTIETPPAELEVKRGEPEIQSTSTAPDENNSTEAGSEDKPAGDGESKKTEVIELKLKPLSKEEESSSVADEIIAESKRKEDEAKAKEEEKKKEEEAKAKAEEDKKKEEADKGKSEEEKAKEAKEAKEKEAEEALKKETPGGAHVKSSTKKDWEALKQAGTHYKEKAEQAQKRIAELELEREELTKKAAVEDGKLPVDVQEELKALRQAVAEFDVTRDPEFKKNYDAPIDTAGKQIMEFFESIATKEEFAERQKAGMTKEALTSIKNVVSKHGWGWAGWDAYLQQCIEAGAITKVEERQIVDRLTKIATASVAREAAIKTANEHAAQRAAQREASAKAEHERIATFAKQLGSETKAELDKIMETYEWAKPPKEPAKTASDEEKASYKEKLAHYEEKSAIFPRLLRHYYNSQGVPIEGQDNYKHLSPKEFMSFAADAFRAQESDRRIKALEAEIKARDEELKEFRSGGATAPRSGAKGGSSEKGPKPAIAPMSVHDALSGIA